MTQFSAGGAPSPVDVRGHRAFTRQAHPLSRAFALWIDACAGALLFSALIRYADAMPIPALWWPVAILPAGAFLWALGRASFGVSLGERLLSLRVQPAEADAGIAARFRRELVQSGAGLVTPTGMFLTMAATAAAPLGFWALCSGHPVWLKARFDREQPFDAAKLFSPSGPEANGAATVMSAADWVVSPFYYALGVWPASFDGSPVFFTIPYEKGPPSRFIGHLIARWDPPDVRLTFEGPRTPPVLGDGRIPRSALELCLAGAAPQSWSCLRARKAALERHLSEIKAALEPRSWSLEWLQIDNPAVPLTDRVQGFYLSARGDAKAEDRFVLVLPNGAEQTMTLEYPTTSRGNEARELFRRSIRSLQVSPDLAQGIRWADHEIEGIRLDDLGSIASTSALVARLARIQTVLIGKLSVDPKTYDTYFHLAGTASLLAGEATKAGREDWLGVARGLIQNLYYYAKDIAPADPRTAQLEKLWLEIKSR